MRLYSLDTNLSTNDALLVAAAKNARDAGKIAADALAAFIAGGSRAAFKAAAAKRDSAERAEMMLVDLAGYADGYPAHVIAAIGAE